jgi:hypothetical protein
MGTPLSELAYLLGYGLRGLILPHAKGGLFAHGGQGRIAVWHNSRDGLAATSQCHLLARFDRMENFGGTAAQRNQGSIHEVKCAGYLHTFKPKPDSREMRPLTGSVANRVKRKIQRFRLTAISQEHNGMAQFLCLARSLQAYPTPISGNQNTHQAKAKKWSGDQFFATILSKRPQQ